MSLNLAGPIRIAMLAEPSIAGLLSIFRGEPAIATRRPLPAGMGRPCIAVSPDVTVTDEDALNSPRPVVVRDIIAYGDQPDDYRVIEDLGYAMRDFFHRNRFSIVPDGYAVIDIVARGPFPAPTDSEKTVARMVSLTIRLQRRT